MMTYKNILITGGTGLVGKALSKMLLDKGYAVTILSRNMKSKTAINGLSFANWDINKNIIDDSAITNADYNTRDAQIAIIKTELSKIPAIRAVYYLVGEGKVKLATNDEKSAFHALSEAYGFIWCLRFTQNPLTNLPYFTTEEVKNIRQFIVKFAQIYRQLKDREI